MKGIILAGGTGSRLHPASLSVSKQLLPVYDKPMIYYPLTTLMLAGITDILIITTTEDSAAFTKLLGDGSQFGVNLSFAEQERPDGLPQAFIIAERYLDGQSAALVLGDNIFYGPGLGQQLVQYTFAGTCTIFGYWVRDPSRYGVIEFDRHGKAVSLEEKPLSPKSNYALTGLFFLDPSVCDRARSLTPSTRGELEITDLLRSYHSDRLLDVALLPRGTAWMDAGTFAALNDASNFVRSVENSQGLKVGCPEEVAWRMGYIDDEALQHRAHLHSSSGYGDYLRELLTAAPLLHTDFPDRPDALPSLAPLTAPFHSSSG